MNKWIYLIIALLSLGASVAMYVIGSNSSHVDELLNYFWYPLILSVITIIGFFTAGKKQQ